MTTQTDIPSDLTDDSDHKAVLFQICESQLNSTILYALLHGIYTGILAVTLWNISEVNHAAINKCRPIRRAMVIVTILLYALITINFATVWSLTSFTFIENEPGFWTVSSKVYSPAQALFWEGGVTAIIGTIVADIYMIWCCWMVWGRRWIIILLPILSLICATVSKIIKEYHEYFNTPEGIFPMLYISFILVTTLWCTVLIIYRILTVAGVNRGAGGRLKVYHRFIGVLVESSALYSISLVVDLALTICEDDGMFYLDSIASITKGIAPTLLIGRAAAGHTRPKDDCDESAVSTLCFQPMPSELCTTSFQGTTRQSAVLEIDIEAQPEQLEVIVEKT
ncbi:hypothetical protein ARMGADRAFT_1064809 [Armillaria gallica]|uniref:Uncharacterized protein n=1 Tax=Armillaria gallica TaxID=47427 RepID=A0A2H3DG25_ARMGA|nr:hypothetical protein ARMGADRAFT_1064809 [Armillaria gallica]